MFKAFMIRYSKFRTCFSKFAKGVNIPCKARHVWIQSFWMTENEFLKLISINVNLETTVNDMHLFNFTFRFYDRFLQQERNQGTATLLGVHPYINILTTSSGNNSYFSSCINYIYTNKSTDYNIKVEVTDDARDKYLVHFGFCLIWKSAKG